MNAREMFEQLGYKKLNTTTWNITYAKMSDAVIRFYVDNGSYYKRDMFNSSLGISVKEHKAIHQQLKELGWLDE